MPVDDWALGQNIIDVRNEAIRVRHGAYVCHDPEADWIAMLADDPDLHMVNADPVVYDQAHPCECEGLCECDNQ